MQLVSVNVGQAVPIANAKAVGKTGIFKRPVSGPVRVTREGLADDAICDTSSHGGVDQALYVFGAPDYAWWSDELGMHLEPGTFGENLTISELESARLHIGDRLRVGAVTLEVTAPRVPCVTLARRMGDPAFLKLFRSAERPGVYCRVLDEGAIQTGDPVTLEPVQGNHPIPAIEMFRTFFDPEMDEVALRRYLAAPIAERARFMMEEMLRQLEARRTGRQG
jgi:MOSC domain-containing protein YiiM